jgi:hypothetical protein
MGETPSSPRPENGAWDAGGDSQGQNESLAVIPFLDNEPPRGKPRGIRAIGILL